MNADDPKPVVWVVGGGSGMGRSSALSAASSGWRVYVSGRRREALDETVRQVSEAGGDAVAVVTDVADEQSVADAYELVRAEGRLDAVVVAAGLNSPRRRWEDQSMADFTAIVETNLNGVARVVDAALPALRDAGGVAVLISSYSGWEFSPGAGVAYGASKTALQVLARSLNVEEAAQGVRACHLCPGDVATDFLAMRPNVPDESARSVMLTPDDVARAVQFVLDSPPHVRIDELVISPVSQTP